MIFFCSVDTSGAVLAEVGVDLLGDEGQEAEDNEQRQHQAQDARRTVAPLGHVRTTTQPIRQPPHAPHDTRGPTHTRNTTRHDTTRGGKVEVWYL